MELSQVMAERLYSGFFSKTEEPEEFRLTESRFLFGGDTAECVWEEEPGAVRWSFRPSGRNVKVRVEWHDQRDQFEGDTI